MFKVGDQVKLKDGVPRIQPFDNCEIRIKKFMGESFVLCDAWTRSNGFYIELHETAIFVVEGLLPAHAEIITCECGADSVQGLHSIWCPKSLA